MTTACPEAGKWKCVRKKKTSVPYTMTCSKGLSFDLACDLAFDLAFDLANDQGYGTVGGQIELII